MRKVPVAPLVVEEGSEVVVVVENCEVVVDGGELPTTSLSLKIS
jgi:hypothetical protein